MIHVDFLREGKDREPEEEKTASILLTEYYNGTPDLVCLFSRQLVGVLLSDHRSMTSGDSRASLGKGVGVVTE